MKKLILGILFLLTFSLNVFAKADSPINYLAIYQKAKPEIDLLKNLESRATDLEEKTKISALIKENAKIAQLVEQAESLHPDLLNILKNDNTFIIFNLLQSIENENNAEYKNIADWQNINLQTIKTKTLIGKFAYLDLHYQQNPTILENTQALKHIIDTDKNFESKLNFLLNLAKEQESILLSNLKKISSLKKISQGINYAENHKLSNYFINPILEQTGQTAGSIAITSLAGHIPYIGKFLWSTEMQAETTNSFFSTYKDLHFWGLLGAQTLSNETLKLINIPNIAKLALSLFVILPRLSKEFGQINPTKLMLLKAPIDCCYKIVQKIRLNRSNLEQARIIELNLIENTKTLLNIFIEIKNLINTKPELTAFINIENINNLIKKLEIPEIQTENYKTDLNLKAALFSKILNIFEQNNINFIKAYKTMGEIDAYLAF